MRSIQKMPDFNQRASYLIYVRDSFRRRAHIPLKSREVILAYRDGLEQVDSMEYYHLQMKVKQNEVQQELISLPNISSTSGDDADSMEYEVKQNEVQQESISLPNISSTSGDDVDSIYYHNNQIKVKQNEVQESISLPNISSISGEASKSHISEWLVEVLPHLNEGDVTTYTRHLVDDGFDSVSFMKEELLAEDLSFMKKAHRRVIERKMKEWIDSR